MEAVIQTVIGGFAALMAIVVAGFLALSALDRR